MEAWDINSIDEHQDYNSEVEKLNELKLEAKKLEQEQIPQKEQEHEVLKRRSIETEKVSWHEVQDSKQEVERLNYKLYLLQEKIEKQLDVVERLKVEARDEVNSEAKVKMLEAIKKATEGYDMIQEAHNEFKHVRSKQLQGLKLSSGEHKNHANAPTITLGVPEPMNMNPFWYKNAKKYISKHSK